MVMEALVAEIRRAVRTLPVTLLERNEIADAVFAALTNGTPIGISGRDRIVHEVSHHGRPVRIAITVGANPISLDRKLKPLP
ncbi:hypothetical protein ACOBQX_00975 [Actinokineospora sp. G85]|uniref:hypothetical protein n=1 Tax=Actinokineospora sp. G85 TaxID=3406626 RepID=UPI003C76F34D